jgi:hypothetical protein
MNNVEIISWKNKILVNYHNETYKNNLKFLIFLIEYQRRVLYFNFFEIWCKKKFS